MCKNKEPLKKTIRYNPFYWIFRGFLRFYQLVISPLTGPNCRFLPCCSRYAIDAIDRHGAGKGLYLSVRRVLKCHPWYHGDFIDPVPEAFTWAQIFGIKRLSDKHQPPKDR